MATTPVPLRISRNLLEVARVRARQQGIDRAAALRQLLREGAQGYVLSLLAEGRLSLSRAAELLECSTVEIHRLAAERGVRLGGDAGDYARARDSLPSTERSGR
jgi:predicted HTH domain antitoxin